MPKRRDPFWTDHRARSSAARKLLTAELARRGVSASEQYRELTNLLSAGVFGLDVNAHLDFKRLDRSARPNLRDHMTDLELSLTELAESTAAILLRRRDARDEESIRRAVADAAEVAAQARRAVAGKLRAG